MIIKEKICFVVFLLLFFGAYSETKIHTDSLRQRDILFKNKPWTVSHFSGRMGGFWAINQTDVGIGTNNNPYSIVDFENDFGMNQNTASMLFNVDARFGKHHRVDLTYYNILRHKTTTIDKDISFGDHHFPIDSKIRTHFNTNVLRLSYGFAFVSNPHIEFGASLGFHIMIFDTGIDFIGETLDHSFVDNVDFTIPLPDFGLWTTYAFHRNWAISAEMGYFYVKYKKLEGQIVAASIKIQSRLGKHWEIDLGYTLFDLRIDLNRKILKADLEWGYNGPTLCAVYRFGNKKQHP